MSRSVIRLPACPVAEYRPRRPGRRATALGLAATLGMLASCTTLGTNISGRFACGAAEGGSCAPATVIDDKALAEITGESSYRPAGPFQAPGRQASPHRIAYASVAPASVRAGGLSAPKVLRIVFPAHIDAAGRFHETSVVRAVVDSGQWLAATDDHDPALAATQTLNVSPEILSQLGAPVVAEANEVQQTASGTPSAAGSAGRNPGTPTIAAVAAARARARDAATTRGTPDPALPGAATTIPRAGASNLASTNPANRPATFSPRVED